MSRLGIALLGPMLVTRDNRPVTGFEYDKVRALLAYLALEADRPHRREALAGLLWPEQPERSARQGLRNALATLRQAIGDDAADPPFLFITREAVQFNAESDHTLDTSAFAQRLDLAGRHRHRNLLTCHICAAWLREAADLYHGPLLAQFSLPDSAEFENWLVNRREELHRGAMEAFARLAAFYLKRGDYASVRFFAGRQLAYEPWNEPAHRQAMLALARMGDRAGALIQYQLCRRSLEAELGVTPEPETILLFERIRDDGPVTEAAPRIIPRPISPLIGRERDLAALARQLANPDVRLVTIIGPGGVGKTSLALMAGRQSGSDFADGSVFVPLATTADPTGIFPAIAAALGLLSEPSRPIEVQVSDYLRSREILLVLDNFEHLVAGANVLMALIAAAPRLVLLVTSRERLNLSAEWLHELEGLDFPAEDASDPLADFGAMQLFARRARQERADFALLSAEAVAAAEICRLVQGMPLAIELAAAATGGQSTTAIAQALRAGLETLSVEWVDLPPRHRSVRAAFEHSWSMLTEGERRILRRLSVFSGGFDAVAAEAVAEATPADLRRLRDKSLLQAGEGGRFDFHPLIRAFAAERLAARGETAQMAREHLAYFTAMAEEGEPALTNREQLTWIRWLEINHANILAALSWAEEHDYHGAARLAAAMWIFWFLRGHLVVSRRHYERLIAERHTLPVHLRARLLNGYSSTMMGQSDLAEIESAAIEAMACYRDAGDDEGIVLAFHHLASGMRGKGNEEGAIDFLREGIVVARRLPDTSSTAYLSVILDSLSSILVDLGRFDEARLLVQENESLDLERGDLWSWTYELFRSGEINLKVGELNTAREELLKALAIAEEYGDRRMILFTSLYLSEISLRDSDLPEAWRRAETAERYSREVGDRSAHAEVLSMMGDILARRGFPAEAARRYQEAREEYAAIGDESAAQKAAEKLDELALQATD